MSVPTSTEHSELRSQIEELLDRLPSQDFTRPVLNESDFYGASHLIAETIGLKQAPRSLTTWSHGYHREETPAILISHEKRQDQINLVRCERHAQILREAGFFHALAVGIPYLYALKYPLTQTTRIPGSLLVMPTHTLTNLKADPDEDLYLETIEKIRPHFSQVVACLNSECIKNGYWTKRFESAGIPWILGATNADSNSLRRMHAIFASFEFVTSNGYGSHLAYATATGCKFSFFGEWFNLCNRKTLIQNPFYQENPDAVEYVLKNNNSASIRIEFAQFFTKPQEATAQTAWGLRAIGEPAQRPPEEIARLMGWSWGNNKNFPSSSFKQLAPVLGFDQNRDDQLAQMTDEQNRLKGRIEWLEGKRTELKKEAKESAQLAKKSEQQLARCQSGYQKIRRSFIWKLARPFHSIEKRLRKL